VLHDVDFSKAVLIGQGVVVAALVMCMAFVRLDLGNAFAAWYLALNMFILPTFPTATSTGEKQTRITTFRLST